MTRSRPSHRYLALIASAAAMIAVAVPAQARGSAGSGCSSTRERQLLRVTLSWRYRVQLSRVDNGHLHVRTLADRTHAFGTLHVGGATCKRPGGAWRVIDPIGVGLSSVGLDGAGNIVGSGLTRGWGIGIRSGAGGSAPRMAVQVMHCGRGSFFRTLKAITGVPIPRLPFTASAALWAAGQVLPADKVTCGDVGVKALRVVATSAGLLRVVDVGRRDLRAVEVRPGANGGWTTTKSYLVRPIAVTRR